MLVFGIVWGAFSLVFLLLGVHFLRLEQQYEAESETVPGVVTSKRVEEKRERDRETKREKVSKTYYLKYKFSPSEGKEIEAETSVSSGGWESTQAHDTIQIQYLPSDTTRSRVAGETQKTGGYVLTGLGAVGELIGLACVFLYLRRKKMT